VSQQTRMGWDRRMRRWQKRYRGKLYAVSPNQLGFSERTKAATIEAANQWWEAKKQEIDKAFRPDFPVRVKPELHLTYDIPSEISRFIEQPPKTDDDQAVLASWIRRAQTDFQRRRGEFMRSSEKSSEEIEAQTIAAHVDRFIAWKLNLAENGTISPMRFESYRCEIAAFRSWVAAETQMSQIDAEMLRQYYAFLSEELNAGRIRVSTAKQRLATLKQFLRWAYENAVIELPRNIDSRELRFKSAPSTIETFTEQEIRKTLEVATGRTKLYCLLALNCGMSQRDISQLSPSEVDWSEGRIQRKRSKTRSHARVPVVSYLLWRETFELLKQYGNRSGKHALLNTHQLPLVRTEIVNGRTKKTDCVKNAVYRLSKQTQIRRRFTDLRKTSATMLKGSPDHARFCEYFLGHAPATVAERFYARESTQLFDQAMRWLGEQLGLHR